MLEDKYGRRFHYLRLSITDVCNFRCNYCLPDGYSCDHDRDFLNRDEINKIARAFAQMGTRKIRITGGEPSLRKDLPQIIADCAAIEGIEQVALTTNGYKLVEKVQQWRDAGLTRLNVSIDSLDPRLFAAITGHDKLSSILQGLDMALELGLEVKVNAVLLRQYNQQDLERFFSWIKDKAISIRFIELMQTGDNKAFFNAQHVSGLPIQKQLIKRGWQRIAPSQTDGPSQTYHHPDYQGSIGLIMPYSKDFCSSCNRLRISALGKLHLCLFAEQGLDIRKYLKSSDTDLLKSKLKELLGDKDASHWLDEGMTGATKHLAMLGG